MNTLTHLSFCQNDVLHELFELIFKENTAYWAKLRKISDSFEEIPEERDFREFREIREGDDDDVSRNNEENVHFHILHFHFSLKRGLLLYRMMTSLQLVTRMSRDQMFVLREKFPFFHGSLAMISMTRTSISSTTSIR